MRFMERTDRTGREGAPSTTGQRSLARLALLCTLAAIAVLLAFAGLKTFALLAIGVGAVVVMIAGLYLFLVTGSFVRWLAIGACLLAPAIFVVLCVRAELLWEVLAAAGLLLLAVAS